MVVIKNKKMERILTDAHTEKVGLSQFVMIKYN